MTIITTIIIIIIILMIKYKSYTNGKSNYLYHYY